MPGDERVVEVARPEVYLRLENHRLYVEEHGSRIGDVPLQDLAALVLSSPRATLTRGVIDAVTQSGGSIIVCNAEHQPTAMLLPLIGHHAQAQRLIAQAKASLPRKKQVWKQLVQCKIRSQSAVLEAATTKDAGLKEIAKKVRSGDPANVEGWASQRYWPALMGASFRRRREGSPPNNALNYGYAILRAATARAIAATGLHPTLGVKHTSRTNPLCLADDLMEPFRPVVDRLVTRLPMAGQKTLNPEQRAELSACITCRIKHEGESRTVSDWLYRAAASLSAVFMNERRDLLLPSGLEDAASYS